MKRAVAASADARTMTKTNMSSGGEPSVRRRDRSCFRASNRVAITTKPDDRDDGRLGEPNGDAETTMSVTSGGGGRGVDGGDDDGGDAQDLARISRGC